MRILGFGGTSRPGSTSERLVEALLARLHANGARTSIFGGRALAELPHYDPSDRGRTDLQIEFVEAVRRADALVIGTPGYHGGMSGLVKNAIDLLEDTARDTRPYMTDRPVALIVSAAGWQAGGTTLAAMRNIVHAMRGWPTPLGLAVNSVAQKPFDDAGALTDPSVATSIGLLAEQLSDFVGRRV